MDLVPQLHLITPTEPGDLLAAVEAVVDAGAPLVQVRAKAITDRVRFEEARTVTAAIHRRGALALINDRVDIALAVGADGVHLGADDLPVAAARHLLGPDAIIGATARDAATATAAVAAGASYLGVGPVYGTTTKAGLPDPIGVAGLAAVTAAVDVPVVAIAGVTVDQVPELLAAGAHGVAVVGAVFGADDPARATREFLTALGGGR